MPARLAQPGTASEPWQNRVRRVGQTNMTEHDPAVMNVEEWADYWHSCKVDVVFVSVTGILAFLSVQGAVSPARKISQRPRLLR